MNTRGSRKTGARWIATSALAYLLAGCSERQVVPPVETGAGDIEGRIVAAGATLPPSIVSYEGESQERRSRLTNMDGLFSFRGAEAGNGQLWIAPPPGYLLADGQENPVPLFVPDGGRTTVAIRMTPAGDTTVVDSLNVGFIDVRADNDILPANGIYVQAAGAEPGQVHGATTSENGHTFLAVPENVYTITAVPPSWYGLIDITPASLTVTKGQTSSVVIRVWQVGPRPDGSLEIYVANPDSVPAGPPLPAGIPVMIVRTDGTNFSAETETDDSGRAFFDAAPGTYDVTLTVPSGWTLWPDHPNPVEVLILPATSTWARFYLSPGGMTRDR